MGSPRVTLQCPARRWQDVAVPVLDLAATERAKWDLLRDYASSDAEHQPVRKVTVVGNAPVHPDPARVEDIESSDLVIRVNSLALDEPVATVRRDPVQRPHHLPLRPGDAVDVP